MHSSNPSLKLWLKQQSHLFANCRFAILVRKLENGNVQLANKYPENYQPDQIMTSAIKDVLQKKRLCLAPLGEQQMLLAQPVFVHGQIWGAAVFCLDTQDKKNLLASVKLLQQGVGWLVFLLTQTHINSSIIALPSDIKNQQAAKLLQLAENLLKENSLQETAITLVNFLATQMHASRVSLGLQQQRGIELTAVSFSANFDKRTEAMLAISHAMDEAVDQRVDIHYSENADSLPESALIQRCHQNLLRMQKITSIDSFLLRENTQIIGVITLEDSQHTPEQQAFLQATLTIIYGILALKTHNETSIRQQITSQALKKINRWFDHSKVTGKLISAATLISVCILFFPANYWISSDASLQSTYKYVLVSPQDGFLTKINVRPGAEVKKGDLLAQLNDDDLRLERRKLFSQLQQSQQEYDNALANANRVQAAVANEKVAQANAQLSLIEQQQLHTQLLAPSAGIITSDDISQSLGAPVKQGQILFEIAANQGYLVQLMVDERNIAAINTGQKGYVKLTSLPSESFAFTVQAITPVSEIREGKNYFRVDAKLDRETQLLRPGMTGSGKILAGREVFGWIWFHDLWHWLRLTLWI